MMELVHREEGPGKASIANPDTGALVPLGEAATDEIAEAVEALEDLANRVKEAVAEAQLELTERMDKSAKWTATVGPFKLEGKSPMAGTVSYRADDLRLELVKLQRAGVIDQEAVDAAAPRETPQPYNKVNLNGVNALRKAANPEVVAALDRCKVEAEPAPASSRKVKVKRVAPAVPAEASS